MKNKRYIILGSGVLVMVLLTASFAISGFKGQFGPRGGKGFNKERVLSKMDYAVQELKLTAAQQTKYSAIRDKMSAGLEALGKRHEAVREEIKAEWERPDPDIKLLAGKMKKEIESMPNPLVTQIDYMLEVYDILNKEQQKQFVSMLKEHFDKRGPRHDRRGGPGGPDRGDKPEQD